MLLGELLEVSSVGTIDLKPDVDVNMKLQEGIYAFYDNYAISGFILTVSDNIYTDRSKIIAGEKSTSLSIEFSSNGVTFHSNTSRKLHYRLLAYYKWFVVSGGTGLYRTTRFLYPRIPPEVGKLYHHCCDLCPRFPFSPMNTYKNRISIIATDLQYIPISCFKN